MMCFPLEDNRIKTADGSSFVIDRWYAQITSHNGHVIQYILLNYHYTQYIKISISFFICISHLIEEL